MYVPNTVVHWFPLPNLKRKEASARTPYFYIAFLPRTMEASWSRPRWQ